MRPDALGGSGHSSQCVLPGSCKWDISVPFAVVAIAKAYRKCKSDDNQPGPVAVKRLFSPGA